MLTINVHIKSTLDVLLNILISIVYNGRVSALSRCRLHPDRSACLNVSIKTSTIAINFILICLLILWWHYITYYNEKVKSRAKI